MAEERLTREAKRLQTREKLLTAATAEFGRVGMADADIATIVSEAGVAHSTFFFHFPTKEHVLLELEAREERLMADRMDEFLATSPGLGAALHKAVDLLAELESTLGRPLFRDFLASHFSTTRPIAEEGLDHPLVLSLVALFDDAIAGGGVDPDLDSVRARAAEPCSTTTSPAPCAASGPPPDETPPPHISRTGCSLSARLAFS